ncbi:MAG: hypothetical protein MUF58_22620 [Arcicella sp.]|jgi:hypothetical protein|nr:hypothetical protein [Arcicella sp.]
MKIDERVKAIAVIVIILINFLEIFGRKKVPEEFTSFVENVSSQKVLMNRIGGYETFEIKYNESDLQKDSVFVSVSIYCAEKKMVYKGYIKKKAEKWDLTTLKQY